MSRKRKTKAKPTRINPGSSLVHRRVKAMAAAGLVEDQIVLRVGGGIDKNQLRRRYIDSIKEGRVAAQEAQAAENEKLSAKEREMKRVFFAGYGTHWEQPDGTNLLQQGRTLAESKQEWAEWLRRHRRGEPGSAGKRST